MGRLRQTGQAVSCCDFLCVLRAGLRLAAAAAFAQSGGVSAARTQKPAADEAAKEGQKKIDEIAEASPRSDRPGRQPGMRLARPPGGQPALAGRSRHRLSPSRPLRPLWLPRRRISRPLSAAWSARAISIPRPRKRLNGRVHACWLNPALPPDAAAAAANGRRAGNVRRNRTRADGVYLPC